MSDEDGIVNERFHYVVWPELVFGIAGPIGIKIEELCESLEESLNSVGYQSRLIKITDEISDVKSGIVKPKSSSFYEQMKFKMDHASEICRSAKDPSRLMHYALKAIKRERLDPALDDLPLIDIEPIFRPQEIFDKYDKADDEHKGRFKTKVAYIIRQIKRPEEIRFLKTVYGRQFVLISAYGSEDDRRRILEEKLRRSMKVSISTLDVRNQVEDLLLSDMHQGADDYGQHLRDSYHLADAFVDGIDKAKMDFGINRLVNAFFGSTEVAPTKDEFGLFVANTASLRSSDLSRQVGATIMTPEGELVSQGCNEVPKAFGGTYWDTEIPDFRDVKVGFDPNDVKKNEVIRDLIERLSDVGLLLDKIDSLGKDMLEIVERLIDKDKAVEGSGVLKGALALDITEYGRVVHAEMNAICEASRLGHKIIGSSLYCTTFPCHNCTKHIIAAGVKKVIYLEPYPKSKARELFNNEISIEQEDSTKVEFLPFVGIAPNLFRYVFTKGKRKVGENAKRWIDDKPVPMVDVLIPTYILFEDAVTDNLDREK